MRVVVWEYVTGGGFGGSGVVSSLLAEGRMMLQQVLQDLAAIPDCLGVTAALAEAEIAAPGEIHPITAETGIAALWDRLIAGADLVWPIAPETDGILERMVATLCAAGKPVLACGPLSLAIAAAKSRTSRHLAEHGIAVVPTFQPGETLPPSQTGYVIKPDDGAGAEATFRVDVPPATFEGVIQPYLEGPALSLSLITASGEAWLLTCNRQRVDQRDGQFRYRGTLVGGAEDRRAVLQPIAAAVARALPDLWGYVGIDLIDTVTGPIVLEINPRLTTSYVGLGAATGLNPAEVILHLRTTPLAALRCQLSVRDVLVEVP